MADCAITANIIITCTLHDAGWLHWNHRDINCLAFSPCNHQLTDPMNRQPTDDDSRPVLLHVSYLAGPEILCHRPQRLSTCPQIPTITFHPKPVQSTSYTQFICPTLQINQVHSSFLQIIGATGPSKILAMIYQIKCCHTPKWQSSPFQYYHSIYEYIYIPKWGPSLYFSTKILYTPIFPNTCYMYHLSHPSWFSPPKNNSMWSRSDVAVNIC